MARDCKQKVDLVKAAKRRHDYWGKKRGSKAAAAAILFAAMEKISPSQDISSSDESTDAEDERRV